MDEWREQTGLYPLQQNTTQQEQRTVQTCDVDESQTNHAVKERDKKESSYYMIPFVQV